MANLSIDQLKISKIEEEIVQLAIERGLSTKKNDYKNANKAYDKIKTRKRKLYCLGEDIYIRSMIKLVSMENPYVKMLSAIALLPFEELIARQELEKLSKDPGLFGFEAEMTLKEWDKGNLNLLPK